MEREHSRRPAQGGPVVNGRDHVEHAEVGDDVPVVQCCPECHQGAAVVADHSETIVIPSSALPGGRRSATC